jgi:hypothetical protein
LLDPLDPPRERMDALAEMKLAEDGFDPPPPPGPPMRVQPLQRPRIPEVDWRQEEALGRDGQIVVHEFTPSPKGAP